VVLVDYYLGAHNGAELIAAATQAGVQAPMLLLTGQGSYEVDVEAMQAGAVDYLSKLEINPALLERSIRYAIDRKQAERSLQVSEQRLRMAQEAGQIGSFEWDPARRLSTWSPQAYRLMGILEGAPDFETQWKAAVHPADRADVAASGERCDAAGTLEMEFRYFHPADSAPMGAPANPRWFYLKARRMEREDGRPVILGIFQDITGRKETELALEAANASLRERERALRESEERFRVALRSAPITVFSLDRELRYTWVFQPQHGFDASLLLGRRLDELVEPHLAVELLAIERRVIEQGESIHMELPVEISGQRSHWIGSLEPARDAQGNITGLVGSAMEVTNLRRLEQEQVEQATRMEVQRRLLEHREMERQQIARDLHDGPIQTLIALLFSLKSVVDAFRPGEPPAALNEVRGDLQALVTELREVCNQLRPPSLVQFGLEHAIRSHAGAFQEKNDALKIHLDLKEEGERLPSGVRLALYRIYQESVNNVVRHSHASELTVRLRVDGRQALLETRDNGVGFSLPKDWVSLARDGHLGLVGMKERAEAVGGVLQVETRPGQGARLRVVVPLP
jgi:PAS domain S-box-containing protein